jgi:hypothetical protein
MLAIGVLVGTAGPAGASTQTAHSTTTTAAINAASDRVVAQAINLTGNDLPGWQESPNPPNASGQSLGAKMSACVGVQDSKKSTVVDVTSANFDKGPVELSSDVTMVRSHADGLADLHGITSPKVPSCAQKVFVPFIAAQLPGASVSKLRVKNFAPPGSPPNSFGQRITMTLIIKHQGVTTSVPLTITEIGFLVGRAEVSLNVNQKGRASTVAVIPGLIHTLDTRAKGVTTS